MDCSSTKLSSAMMGFMITCAAVHCTAHTPAKAPQPDALTALGSQAMSSASHRYHEVLNSELLRALLALHQEHAVAGEHELPDGGAATAATTAPHTATGAAAGAMGKDKLKQPEGRKMRQSGRERTERHWVVHSDSWNTWSTAYRVIRSWNADT